jgi:phytoene dehydrogenase-like protein
MVVDAEVRKILTRSREVTGVELGDGTVLHSSVVISNADPRTTLRHLIDEAELPRETRQQVERIDMRGSMARVHFLVDRLPQYDGMPSGPGPHHAAFTLLGVGREEFEQARVAQLEGRIADHYPIELLIPSVSDPALAPPGLHTVTTGAQQIPFHLSSGTWDVRGQEFVDSIVRSIESFAPGFESSIRGTVSITPLDLERTYGLPEGNIFHGAMSMNQLFASRQIAGSTGYGTPIRGLYLCGAGMHPGGAVMGAAGHNVAMSLLESPSRHDHVTRSPRARRGFADLVMNDSRLNRLRYRVARNRLARPIVSALTRRR